MMDATDLFAGPGGWSLACQRLGVDEYGVENDKAARETREAAGFKTVHSDVWTHTPLQSDGLIASPPCQTFSAAGKGTGRKALDDVLRAIKDGRYKSLESLWEVAGEVGDERTALVLTPMYNAWIGVPRWIAFEQVPTVLPVWEACAEVLWSWGYSVWTGNLQAETFGVPQTRKRAILIASRDRDVTSPRPTHSRYYPRSPDKLDPGVQKWVSMAEALGWGLSARPSPTVTGGGTETGGAEPIAHLSRWTDRTDWAYRSTPMANSAVRTLDQPAPTIMHGHETPRRVLPEWCHERPAPTVVGSRRSRDGMVIGRQLAPGESTAVGGHGWDGESTSSNPKTPPGVRVTVEEAGVLQSFPADFPWQGAKTKRYQQVGNAIPPLLAEAILREATGL